MKALAVAALLVVLWTPLGAFVCDGIACVGTPDPDYRGYWKPPMLLITVANRPFAVLDCRRAGGEAFGFAFTRPPAVELWAC